jgi:hypothetical protein
MRPPPEYPTKVRAMVDMAFCLLVVGISFWRDNLTTAAIFLVGLMIVGLMPTQERE